MYEISLLDRALVSVLTTLYLVLIFSVRIIQRRDLVRCRDELKVNRLAENFPESPKLVTEQDLILSITVKAKNLNFRVNSILVYFQSITWTDKIYIQQYQNTKPKCYKRYCIIQFRLRLFN